MPRLEAEHRKRWIAFGRAAKGALCVDGGACDALLHKGTSLLAVGVLAVEGAFEMGEAVSVQDDAGNALAQGLSNYSSQEVDLIKGCRSTEIESILGYKDYDEVIHRDNLVIL